MRHVMTGCSGRPIAWLGGDPSDGLVMCSTEGGPTLYVSLSEPVEENGKRLAALTSSWIRGELEELCERVLPEVSR